jgi:hypothetical protein
MCLKKKYYLKNIKSKSENEILAFFVTVKLLKQPVKNCLENSENQKTGFLAAVWRLAPGGCWK